VRARVEYLVLLPTPFHLNVCSHGLAVVCSPRALVLLVWHVLLERFRRSGSSSFLSGFSFCLRGPLGFLCCELSDVFLLTPPKVFESSGCLCLASRSVGCRNLVVHRSFLLALQALHGAIRVDLPGNLFGVGLSVAPQVYM